jgi:hypothetical protein
MFTVLAFLSGSGFAVASTVIPTTNRYEFYLRITADQYLDYYRGTARHVVVRCTTGQSVQFPASLLQQYVTEDGNDGLIAGQEKSSLEQVENPGGRRKTQKPKSDTVCLFLGLFRVFWAPSRKL